MKLNQKSMKKETEKVIKNIELDRVVIINSIIKKIGATSYLEIGVENGHTFKSISKKITYKVGVDPNPLSAATIHQTSDEFFASLDNSTRFDVIFIDGLHHAAQVAKDITNALNHLSLNGVIVVHDLNPIEEIHQRVPRVSGIWNGDVWRAWVELKVLKPEVKAICWDCDQGTGVITKKLPKNDFVYSKWDVSRSLFDYFDENRVKMLNLQPTSKFQNWLVSLPRIPVYKSINPE